MLRHLAPAFLALVLALPAQGAQPPAEISLELDPPPCTDAVGWRAGLCSFAREALQHDAWGFAHAERDYLLARALARRDDLAVDDDVLFAAAMLHDLGGFEPYRQDGVDHAERSAQLAPEQLAAVGFPQERVGAVQEAIRAHSYYHSEPPTTPEGVVLHDADTLDFLGVIGATRILSITGREAVVPDLAGSVALLERLASELPERLHGGATSHRLGALRAAELTLFLGTLRRQTSELGAL